MRKNGRMVLAVLTGLALLGLVNSARASNWIQQNKWTVAGPYISSGCGPGNAFISSSLLTDMGFSDPTYQPIHGDPSPNLANIKNGAWEEFVTWQHLGTRGVGAGDLVNLNDAVWGSDPNDCYGVGVIYVKNKTGAPMDIQVCSSSDDAIGIVLNGVMIHNNNACRGDQGGCSDRVDAVLPDGISTLVVAAYEAGGGFNYRCALVRRSDGSFIDDTEAVDVAFDRDPNGRFDQFAIRRTVEGNNVCGTDKVAVTLKSNGLYLDSPSDVIKVTERITGPVTIGDITGGGVLAVDAPATNGCDLGGTIVGDFATTDVGGPPVAGSTVQTGTAYALTAGGGDIWAGGDEFQYAYKKVAGDFSMSARITGRDYLTASGNPPSRWGKFGVMARQDCSKSSRYVFAHDCSKDSNGTDPDNTRMAARPTYGVGDNYETGHGNAGHHADWVRVDRVNNQFYAYASPDGANWVLLGQQHWHGAPPECLIGLAVTSHAGAAPIKITFDEVKITTGDPPPAANTLTSATVTWDVKVSDLDGAGVSYSITADAQVTSVANFTSRMGGGDDKGHPTAGQGSVFFGHERGGVGPHFTHSFDIGNDLGGVTTYDAASDEYTQRGSGFDHWGDNDTSHWAYSYVTGDFDVISEVTSRTQPTGHPWGRYGLMARTNCAQNARYSATIGQLGNMVPRDGRDKCVADFRSCTALFQSHVYFNPGQFVAFDVQMDPGVRYTDDDHNAPTWTRLVGYKGVIYGFGSNDEGESWRPIGSMPWYGHDPAVPIQVGHLTQQHGDQIEAPVTKFKIHRFGPLDTGMPMLPDDGKKERLQELFDPFDSLDTVAWSVQKRDATFVPAVINGRMRINQEEGGESTSCFSKFGVEGVDDRILEFDFDAYMARNNADHPADALCFVVIGDSSNVDRVGFGGGANAYLGLSRARPGNAAGVPTDTSVGNNSFAVEIDTWSGGGWHPNEGQWMETKQWHLGISSGNNVNAVQQVILPLSDPAVPTSRSMPDVFDPNGIHVRVRYNRGNVQVWLAQNTAEGPGDLEKALEADVIPISFGWPDGTATYGWTGGTGGAVQVAEVDNIEVNSIDCNEIPEVAVISGAPASVKVGDPINLGSTGSSAGVGDTGTLSYKWEVTGPGTISGADNGATVAINTTAAGPVKAKLTVSDGSQCPGDPAASAEVTVTVEPLVTVNWVLADCNGDKTADISDAVCTLGYLFLGGALAGPGGGCLASLNFNGDLLLDISDPVALLGVLFLGSAPPDGFQKCGTFAGCSPNCP